MKANMEQKKTGGKQMKKYTWEEDMQLEGSAGNRQQVNRAENQQQSGSAENHQQDNHAENQQQSGSAKNHQQDNHAENQQQSGSAKNHQQDSSAENSGQNSSRRQKNGRQNRQQNTPDNDSQNQNAQERKTEKEIEQKEDEKLNEYGQMTLEQNQGKKKIHLLSIIGEVEGHENLSGSTKATKYDHVLPQLAALEDDDSVQGLLILLNTSGGDVDAGLAIAEMIASLSMPTVSLVLGGSHSIGVPLAVSTDYSFIVPTGTMMIHPVRMSGLVIGAAQTYEYFEMIQDRILTFISTHANAAYDQVKRLMLNTEMLTRDLGTVLVGGETVEHGLINEVGGIREALNKLYEMVDERENAH